MQIKRYIIYERSPIELFLNLGKLEKCAEIKLHNSLEIGKTTLNEFNISSSKSVKPFVLLCLPSI